MTNWSFFKPLSIYTDRVWEKVWFFQNHQLVLFEQYCLIVCQLSDCLPITIQTKKTTEARKDLPGQLAMSPTASRDCRAFLKWLSVSFFLQVTFAVFLGACITIGKCTQMHCYWGKRECTGCCCFPCSPTLQRRLQKIQNTCHLFFFLNTHKCQLMIPTFVDNKVGKNQKIRNRAPRGNCWESDHVWLLAALRCTLRCKIQIGFQLRNLFW